MASFRSLTWPGVLRDADVYLVATWVLIVLGLLGVAVMWALPSPLAAPRKTAAEPGEQESADRYHGTIVSRSFRQDVCTEYQFDNKTGAFVHHGQIACLDFILPKASSDSLEYRRFKSVKNAFGGGSR